MFSSRNALVSLDGFRQDGRRPHEVRESQTVLSMADADNDLRVGAATGTSSPAGSAFFRLGNTACSCKIFVTKGQLPPARARLAQQQQFLTDFCGAKGSSSAAQRGGLKDAASSSSPAESCFSSSSDAAMFMAGASGMSGTGLPATGAASSAAPAAPLPPLAEQTSPAQIRVETTISKFAAGGASATSCALSGRDSARQARAVAETNHRIAETFAPVVLLEQQNLGLEIHLHLQQVDGSALACLVNATCLALADAGVAMRCLVSAVSVACVRGPSSDGGGSNNVSGDVFLTDLCEEEERDNLSQVTIAAAPGDRVLLLASHTGDAGARVPVDKLGKLLKTGLEGCDYVRGEHKRALLGGCAQAFRNRDEGAVVVEEEEVLVGEEPMGAVEEGEGVAREGNTNSRRAPATLGGA